VRHGVGKISNTLDVSWGSATWRWKDLEHSRRELGECDMALERSRTGLQVCFRPRPDRRSGREAMTSQSPGSPKPEQSRDKQPLGCGCGAKNTIGRMVVTPPEPGPWCVM
jgi:hypothetical protein